VTCCKPCTVLCYSAFLWYDKLSETHFLTHKRVNNASPHYQWLLKKVNRSETRQTAVLTFPFPAHQLIKSLLPAALRLQNDSTLMTELNAYLGLYDRLNAVACCGNLNGLCVVNGKMAWLKE